VLEPAKTPIGDLIGRPPSHNLQDRACNGILRHGKRRCLRLSYRVDFKRLLAGREAVGKLAYLKDQVIVRGALCRTPLASFGLPFSYSPF
jgi:hypothetical protein